MLRFGLVRTSLCALLAVAPLLLSAASAQNAAPNVNPETGVPESWPDPAALEILRRGVTRLVTVTDDELAAAMWISPPMTAMVSAISCSE